MNDKVRGCHGCGNVPITVLVGVRMCESCNVKYMSEGRKYADKPFWKFLCANADREMLEKMRE